MAYLTLLATGSPMKQRVEEQLEGCRWAQVVQQLQKIWLRQESLASIKSLRKRPEGGSEQSPQSPAPLYNVYFFLTVPDLFFRSSLLFNLEVWKNHSGYHQWNTQPLAV